MSRFTIAFVSVAVLAFDQVVVAQVPVLDNVITDQRTFLDDPTEFVDLNGSAKVLTVPRGKVFVTWSLTGHALTGSPSDVLIRLVVGPAMPDNDFFLHANNSTVYETHSGSWVTETEGGEMTVKLQAKKVNALATVFEVTNLSWSIVVLPETVVPAVGNVGLVIMAVVVLGAGAIVLSRRKQPVV